MSISSHPCTCSSQMHQGSLCIMSSREGVLSWLSRVCWRHCWTSKVGFRQCLAFILKQGILKLVGISKAPEWWTLHCQQQPGLLFALLVGSMRCTKGGSGLFGWFRAVQVTWISWWHQAKKLRHWEELSLSGHAKLVCGNSWALIQSTSI